MKEYIEYYYNISDIILYRNGDNYSFKYAGKSYYFVPLVRKITEIGEINKYIEFNKKNDQIIKNIYNQLITRIANKNYLLIEKSDFEENILESIVNNNEVFFDNYSSIDRSNWVQLWSNKIDNIEYQTNHLEGKYPVLSEFINYYIGMTESAISYVNDLSNNSDFFMNSSKVISHLRIFEKNFNSPQNIIIDYKSRDVSEYLKFVFLNGNYDYSQIEKFLSDLNYDSFSLGLIYGRLFFPTFFFDQYDKIINSEIEEKEIFNIVSRIDEYEEFINNIYFIINQQKKIPKLCWE